MTTPRRTGVVVTFDSPSTVAQQNKGEELSGSLASQDQENKLMRSVLENDKAAIDEGNLITEALNQGLSGFTPDLMFSHLVKNYSLARQLYGETLLRLSTGYNPDYIKKNIGIPEFRKELQQRIEQKHQELEHRGTVGAEGAFTEQGILLASLVLYTEELDHLISKGIFGEKVNKERFLYGAQEDTRQFRRGDRYRDIALKESLKRSIRRSHSTLEPEDLRSFDKESKGQAHIIYALDASGSMKGKKIEACKKAGIALAYKAISEKDKVGVMIFGSDIKDMVEPTTDFMRLLLAITGAKAARETDIAATLQKSVELFPSQQVTKHLLIITDALPTKGAEPEKTTLDAAATARNEGITISVIGINLDTQGKNLAQKITNIGNGRLYVVADSENLDQIVLQEYQEIA